MDWLDGRSLAEFGELVEIPGNWGSFAARVKIGRAQFLIRLATGEPMIEADQSGMSHGNDGARGTATGGEPMVEGLGTLFAHRSPGDLRHDGMQVTVALGRASRVAFATALIIAGGEASPGGKLIRRRKLGHVQPDFRQDGLSSTGVH